MCMAIVVTCSLTFADGDSGKCVHTKITAKKDRLKGGVVGKRRERRDKLVLFWRQDIERHMIKKFWMSNQSVLQSCMSVTMGNTERAHTSRCNCMCVCVCTYVYLYACVWCYTATWIGVHTNAITYTFEQTYVFVHWKWWEKLQIIYSTFHIRGIPSNWGIRRHALQFSSAIYCTNNFVDIMYFS